MRASFTAPDAWSGGPYELHMRLPRSASAAHALAALWGSPQLDGCFRQRDIEPGQQAALDIKDLPADGEIYGTALLGEGRECVCASFIAAQSGAGRWLCLYLPLGALGAVFPLGGYPFGPSTPERERALQEINQWLRDLAAQIYQRQPFEMAIIGFDCELIDLPNHPIPERHWDGFLIPQGDRLVWHPPTAA